MYFIYILHSNSKDCYYTGHTDDLEYRLKRHNKGMTKSTKSGIPWYFVYSEQFKTRTEAIKREIEIKRWKSRKMIENLIKSNNQK
ncbi:MAG: GIY-YIG nuclease family protein [Candidatus Marinimicrobia bacterium]|nr:GIY-YIG nuclease family protein [Candidatus Neomarinimicrobiota bacterium]